MKFLGYTDCMLTAYLFILSSIRVLENVTKLLQIGRENSGSDIALWSESVLLTQKLMSVLK